MTVLHALASGNGKILVDRFDGTVSGTWSDWSLQLRPELPAATVTGGKHDITEPDRPIEIRLEGRDDVIERLRIDPRRSGPTTLEFLPGETGS